MQILEKGRGGGRKEEMGGEKGGETGCDDGDTTWAVYRGASVSGRQDVYRGAQRATAQPARNVDREHDHSCQCDFMTSGMSASSVSH